MIARYEYDALNRRTKKHLNADTDDDFDSFQHLFYNAAWQIMETRLSESENTGPETLQPEYQHIWSLRYIDAAVLRDKNTDEDDLCDDQRLYYTNDANMNVTALVGDDGTVLERYVYDPYGKVTVLDPDFSADADGKSDYDNNILFCGYYYDWKTGWYHVRNRYYHPYFGWVTREPTPGDNAVPPRIGHYGPAGPYADGMNLYQYVRSRPTVVVDPTGEYGYEVHYADTKLAALDAYLCAKAAEAIGVADQSWDEGGREAPVQGVFSLLGVGLLVGTAETYDVHFPDAGPPLLFVAQKPVVAGSAVNVSVKKYIGKAKETCDVADIGKAMHALQDSYSHAGQPSAGGHPAGRPLLVPGTGRPDKPSGGLFDQRVDDPRQDPASYRDCQEDVQKVMNDIAEWCWCVLCPGGDDEPVIRIPGRTKSGNP